MQHVGIAEHDVRLAADRAPRVRRRVAVVGEDADLQLVVVRHELRQRVQLRELILRQRLCRKQIQRARRRILQDGVEHRRVVAERLARRRRRDRDDVAAGEHVLERLGLVRVELTRCRARPARPPGRSSVPSGNGAKVAATAGSRWAAVTMGSASARRAWASRQPAEQPPGGSGPCRRKRRGGSGEPFAETVEAKRIAGPMVAGGRMAIKRRKMRTPGTARSRSDPRYSGRH